METCQLIANGRNDYQLSKQSENERVYIIALHCSLSPYCHLNLRHTHNIGTHWTGVQFPKKYNDNYQYEIFVR